MSKFFEFVSANLRLAGNLMISPSERFHAGHITSTVSGLAFEGLRGVTESFDAAAHSISKKAHKSLWATFCDSIDFSESITAFGLMAAPSERTSVAAQSLWTTYCDSSAYAETRMPQAQAQSKSERSSWWANFSLMVSPSSVMSPVAMRQFAQSPILAQLREEAALKPAVKHESVFATLAQTSAYSEERTDLNPAEHAVPAAKAETSMSHERLADLLAQSWLTPMDRLVALREPEPMAAPAAPAPEAAPEVAAETSLSHERLADMLAQSWLTPMDRLVALREPEPMAAPAAPAPEAAPEVAAETSLSHERLADMLAQSWLTPTDRLVAMREPEPMAAPEVVAAPVAAAPVAARVAPEAQAESSLSHERLADMLAQSWLTPTDQLVAMREPEPMAAPEVVAAPVAAAPVAARVAPEAQAESSLSHERLADMLAQSWLTPTDQLVAMREPEPMAAQAAPAPEAKVEAQAESSMSHERLSDLLAQSWFTPAQDLVNGKPTPSVAHARLADLLAQCSLSPTQRLVDLQVAPQAPEVQAESLSSYALAALTEQPALSNEELTSLYLKRFAWLDSTQSLLMAHLAQTIAQSDNEVKVQEPETEAYVAARWDGIVNALTEDTPQAIAALPYKAPAAPESGVLTALKRMTASESKKIAAQVSAGHRLPRLS